MQLFEWGAPRPAAALGLMLALMSWSAQGASPRFNDSGQSACIDPADGLAIDCTGTGQDGEHGRDATHPRKRDGRAGFSFVKVASDGTELPPGATDWACVHDVVTGLTWEVKTRKGPRDRNRTYTRYGDGRSGEVSLLVDDVNAQGLCGYQDWRLPGVQELLSLVDFGVDIATAPRIDTRWIPNTPAETYWSAESSPVYGLPAFWGVHFRSAETGPDRVDLAAHRARLVRGTPWPIAGRFSAQGAEVTDPMTGLVWRRCAEGQTWDGGTCTGSSLALSWSDALAQAAAAAAADGLAWRLPNAKELSSLVDTSRINPAIDTQAFPGTQYAQPFWSATWEAGGEAQFVDFGIGQLGVYASSAHRHIRLVRKAP